MDLVALLIILPATQGAPTVRSSRATLADDLATNDPDVLKGILQSKSDLVEHIRTSTDRICITTTRCGERGLKHARTLEVGGAGGSYSQV